MVWISCCTWPRTHSSSWSQTSLGWSVVSSIIFPMAVGTSFLVFAQQEGYSPPLLISTPIDGTSTRFGIDVLSSHPLMAAIEEALEPGDEVKLAEYLTPLKPDYDFILVDAPGHKTKLHDNALVAADLIMVVPASERPSLDGVADLLNRLQGILWKNSISSTKNCGFSLACIGFLPI